MLHAGTSKSVPVSDAPTSISAGEKTVSQQLGKVLATAAQAQPTA